MPPYFLTVRFPDALLRTDSRDDPDCVRDPFAMHEKESRAFYQVDSRPIAKELLELFRCRPPTDHVSTALRKNAEGATEQELRDLEVGLTPIFAVVDSADMDMAQRIFRREEIELLEWVEQISEGDRDPGIWQDAGLPHDRQTVLLVNYHYQAQEWEPLVRDELGIGPGGSSAREKVPETPAATDDTPCAHPSPLEHTAGDFVTDHPTYAQLLESEKDRVVSLSELARLLKRDRKTVRRWLEYPDIRSALPETAYAHEGRGFRKGRRIPLQATLKALNQERLLP